MTTIADVVRVVETLWPASGAEDWDAVGLVVGSSRDVVSHIRLSVDVTPEVILDAQRAGADFLVAHHPLLLRPVTTVAEESYKGACIAHLIRAGIGLLAAHTNADVVRDGVSDTLARALDLMDVAPIISQGRPGEGIGRVGRLESHLDLRSLVQRIAKTLPATVGGIRVSGDPDAMVSSVALCGGAGDSLLGEVAVREADVFITSDLRHHPASEFREWAKLNDGPALIDVSHWASESLWLPVAANTLARELTGVTVSVSEVRTDPWDFLAVQ